MPKYAVFEYIYRDASNYKANGKILLYGVAGELVEQSICGACESGVYFVAEQVELPPLYEDLYIFSGGPTEDDHVFHEFVSLREASEDEKNERCWGALDELVEKFNKAKGSWNYELSPHWSL